jgi:hypothetical protein
MTLPIIWAILLDNCCFAMAPILVPVSVEVRLVGLEKYISVEQVQIALDALATIDSFIFPSLRLGISYRARSYDEKLVSPSDVDFKQTKIKDGLANAEEMDEKIFQKHENLRGFVIYLINDMHGNFATRRAYSSDTTSTGDDYCATQVWVSRRGRYAWIDLAAIEPASDYGPLFDGEGFVSHGRAIPRPVDFTKASFVSRLAALCHRASLHLALPTPQSSISLASSLSPIVIHTYIIASSLDASDNDGLKIRTRWERNFVEPLKQATAVLNSNVTFDIRVISLATCPVCAAAHELALRVRERKDELDARNFRDILMKGLAVETLNSDAFHVFVYKTDIGPFLFEGSKQTVTFSNSLVAIEGTSTEIGIPTNFQCGKEGRAVTSDIFDVSRQAVAGVLQSVFGVAPTYQRYSAALGRFTNDYLFTVGHTPFGPFSRSTHLSMAIQDSVWRNPLLSHLSRSVAILNHVRQEIAELNFPKRKEVLGHLENAELFLRRSSVFIGLLDVEHAKEFALEARKSGLEAKELVSKLTFAFECVSLEDSPSGGDYAYISERDDASFTSAFKLSIIPFLLLFIVFAILYETKIARIRSFISEFPSSTQYRNRLAKDSVFVTPAKKVD